ncbi:hypothetical protein ACMD2_23680 [Ananas comosus]|uniref:Uncharacterized protein n=1 Tax=Ananas comosus TaxID=4615 RepID=A0A199W9R4_ANACO|nr:hypothetical protein ACMD2_23680 [Ananas comosus]
MRKEIGGVPD